MSNKFPQYFTAKGLERRKKRPSPSSNVASSTTDSKKLAEQRLAELRAEQKKPIQQEAQPAKLRKPESRTQKNTNQSDISIVTSPAQKIDRKRRMMKHVSEEKKGISPEAAKAIAEALKKLLNS